jgi:HAD superfamily hydrolase (TIGR01509 family)
MIKAVLFDLDGVLVDACDWHYEALNDALESLCGFRLSREEHELTYNALTTRQKLDRLNIEGRVPANMKSKVWELKQQKTKDTITRLAKRDDEKVKLHQWLLDRGIRIACVTNSIRETAELMLRQTGQFHMMEFIISNQDVRLPKPHGEGYIRAMIRMGFQPDEVLIIEDSPKGIQAAQSTSANIMRVAGSNEVTLKRVREHIFNTEKPK